MVTVTAGGPSGTVTSTLPVPGACSSEASGERAGACKGRNPGEMGSRCGQEHGAESPAEEIRPPEGHRLPGLEGAALRVGFYTAGRSGGGICQLHGAGALPQGGDLCTLTGISAPVSALPGPCRASGTSWVSRVKTKTGGSQEAAGTRQRCLPRAPRRETGGASVAQQEAGW